LWISYLNSKDSSNYKPKSTGCVPGERSWCWDCVERLTGINQAGDRRRAHRRRKPTVKTKLVTSDRNKNEFA
jgi:hypothetical protein